jgi:Domain of unknown function (DUF4190)
MSWPPQEGSPQEPYQQQPQYQQQPPYQPQQGYQYGAQPVSSGRTNTLAILSLVFAFVFWPLGIVFGHMANRQLRTSGEQGAGLAKAGLVLSYVFGAIAILACAFWITVAIVASRNGTTTY